ncbi:helix-turn-helix transcriptional regulator, partial [Eubacterium callanderi]|uniref:helix-turn-helix transcriptional regulator n=1 Tax=Eubacterium callanderi TaxID=53442 RepID=UPI00241F6179
ITEYIQQRRMSQAETLLAKTDLSIGQVAQSVGYTSASRFAELFRKSTGLLPLEYRKVAQRK